MFLMRRNLTLNIFNEKKFDISSKIAHDYTTIVVLCFALNKGYIVDLQIQLELNLLEKY